MRSRGIARRSLTAIFALALLLSGLAGTAIAAHNINAKWKDVVVAPYQNYIRYWYHSSVPANFKPRIVDGAGSWNSAGRELYFAAGTSSNGLIKITYEDLAWPNGDSMAMSMTFAGSCAVTICTGAIAFNTTPSIYHWYTGTGTPNGSNKEVDLWSVAAHEFGHQVSLTHVSGSTYVDDTMWPSTTIADTKQRSITTHDRAGIEKLYPPK